MGSLGQKEDVGEQLGMSAFGLGLLTHATPPGAWEARPLTEPILRLRSATARAVAESWSGLEAIGWEGVIDGAPFVVERGRAGDHRFVHGADPDQRQSGTRADGSDGTRAVHHLSPDASLLQCAPSDSAEQSWWRVVLDSVLFTVALLQGYEALHAGALATPDGVIAITAMTGGGKSTLLSELLRHGLTLMADDVLVLEPSGREAPDAQTGELRHRNGLHAGGSCGDDLLARGGALDRRSGASGTAAIGGTGRAEPQPRPRHRPA
jgi:hypothetical protein